MNSGFTFQECLQLLETKQNKDILLEIKEKLSNGNKIDTFFTKCIPKKYSEILEGFIGYTTFQKSLHLTLQILNSYENQMNRLKKKLLYPTLLLLGTTIGLFFFDRVCIPTLLDLCSSFNNNNINFDIIQTIIHIFVMLLCLIIILFIISYFYLKNEKHLKSFYILLNERFPNSLFIKYITQEFMRYFIECIKSGVSTQNTIQILKRIPHKPIIYMLASEIENSLLQGEAFLNAIKNTHLDNDLIRFMQIAIYSKDKESILSGYISFSENYIERRITQVTNILQTCAYGIIGFFMILIYQILMVPLSLITTL